MAGQTTSSSHCPCVLGSAYRLCGPSGALPRWWEPLMLVALDTRAVAPCIITRCAPWRVCPRAAMRAAVARRRGLSAEQSVTPVYHARCKLVRGLVGYIHPLVQLSEEFCRWRVSLHSRGCVGGRAEWWVLLKATAGHRTALENNKHASAPDLPNLAPRPWDSHGWPSQHDSTGQDHANYEKHSKCPDCRS